VAVVVEWHIIPRGGIHPAIKQRLGKFAGAHPKSSIPFIADQPVLIDPE
jgi:hypothetical protein